jgi:hypothetical protein
VRKRDSTRRSRPSAEEYQRFAEQFVDGILDSRQPWLVEYVLAGGFSRIPTYGEIESGDLALSILHRLGGDWFAEEWKANALFARDRPPLVAWIKKITSEQKRTRDEMSRLLACVNSKVLKRSLTALQRKMTFLPGAKPKLPSDRYSVILEAAASLEPTILKLLTLPETSRSLGEALDYLKKDHPQACDLLSRHIEQFQRALADPSLLKRAKKNIKGRARVLAEAMAGADHQLTFSTSRERVRRARKLADATSFENSATSS